MSDQNCSCHPLHVGNQPIDPSGPKNIDEACPAHGIGTPYYKEKMSQHTKTLHELRIRAAFAKGLINFRSCCLDDDADYRRVLSAITDITIKLIALDRRS